MDRVMNLADLFKKDKNLFDSKIAEKVIVNEDMGSLNLIDQKFRELFKNRSWGKDPNIQNKRVGQASPVETVETSTAREAAKLMFGEENKKSPIIQGMVLIIDGIQALAIARAETGGRYGLDLGYNIILDADVYKTFEQDASKIAKIGKLMHGYDTRLASGKTMARGESEAKAKYILNALYKAAKDAGVKDITALVIKTDLQRLGKQQARQTAKAGSEAMELQQLGERKFKEHARQALWSRLEAFKAKKAEEYKTPEEFLADAIKKGYMEKVNIDGFVYKLDRSEIRISDILNPQKHWTNHNAIVYKLDRNHSEKLDNLRKASYELYKQTENDPEAKKRYEELQAKMPPEEISVKMKMEGGSIVPAGIEVGKKAYY